MTLSNNWVRYLVILNTFLFSIITKVTLLPINSAAEFLRRHCVEFHVVNLYSCIAGLSSDWTASLSLLQSGMGEDSVSVIWLELFGNGTRSLLRCAQHGARSGGRKLCGEDTIKVDLEWKVILLTEFVWGGIRATVGSCEESNEFSYSLEGVV
jgi:hypothetical protein